MKIEQTGNLLFDRDQLFLLSEYCKMILSAVERQRQGGSGVSTTFRLLTNRFEIFNSDNWNWSPCLVVENLHWFTRLLQRPNLIIPGTNVFTLYTTNSVKKWKIVPHIEIFLIDSSEQNINDKKNISEKLSPHQRNLFCLNDFSRRQVALSRTLSTWRIFSDSLSPKRVICSTSKLSAKKAVSYPHLYFCFFTTRFQDEREWVTTLAVFF